MNLEQVLTPDSVSLDLTLTDKPRAIAHAASLLASEAGMPSDVVEGALLAREALGSTGVGGGIALPHARLHRLAKTHAVFLRLLSPIGFESNDARPVDLVCAIIAPDEPSAELLTAVSQIARVLRDQDKTAALRQSHDASEARAILVGSNGG
ncbi:MAG TPA: PTS sugar transporter subunit IIA [Candidatus Limnocylindrales bacterium]|jgi:PTS system nitrogen regulatory IIA component|nr:PTS sugar transporter subunit IIA [Candidatus Limnocylindrales bacterium]